MAAIDDIVAHLSSADAAAMQPETYANPAAKRVVDALMGLATLPKRAIDGAALYQPGSGEIPNETIAPAVETAMTMMGGGIAGAPVRAGETVLGAGPIREITGGRGDPTQTGWIFKDVAKPPMQRGDWRKVTAATDTGDGILNVELPIRSMNATQKTVNPDFASPISDNSEAPFVLKKDGQYYVQDGHHRLTAASEQGRETAPVRLVDLDGTTQTDFPLVDLMNRSK